MVSVDLEQHENGMSVTHAQASVLRSELGRRRPTPSDPEVRQITSSYCGARHVRPPMSRRGDVGKGIALVESPDAKDIIISNDRLSAT